MSHWPKFFTQCLDKEDTSQPLKKSKENFVKKNRRFVLIEFVKTCDELIIGDIAEVRIGHSTDTFNKLVKQFNEGLPKLDGINCARDFCFSIIFKDDTPPLDLVAHDSADRYVQHLFLSQLQSLNSKFSSPTPNKVKFIQNRNIYRVFGSNYLNLCGRKLTYRISLNNVRGQ